MNTVRYRCLKCSYVWYQESQPVHGHGGYLIGYTFAAVCPRCGHEYVTVSQENEPQGDPK